MLFKGTSASKVNQSSLPSWPVMIPALRASSDERLQKNNHLPPASDQAENSGCELVGTIDLNGHDRLEQLPDSVLAHLGKCSLGGLVERPFGGVHLMKLTSSKAFIEKRSPGD